MFKNYVYQLSLKVECSNKSIIFFLLLIPDLWGGETESNIISAGIDQSLLLPSLTSGSGRGGCCDVAEGAGRHYCCWGGGWCGGADAGKEQPWVPGMFI